MFPVSPRRLALALFCASLVLAVAAGAVCVIFGDCAVPLPSSVATAMTVQPLPPAA